MDLKPDNRPSKNEYYLDIARTVAKRSTCLKWRVGAIIVKDDVVVSTGYNGPARGVINCMMIGCLKEEMGTPDYKGYEYCTAVHAEENAIINAARHGTSVLGGTLFLYGEEAANGKPFEIRPCDRCKRAIINAGIRTVITRRADGSLLKTDTEDWIKEDTWNYIKSLGEVKSRKAAQKAAQPSPPSSVTIKKMS